MSDEIRCQKCHSNQIASGQQGFGVGKAAVGLLLICILSLTFTVCAFAGHSSKTFRCGNDLIIVGQSVLALIECMGMPNYKRVYAVTTSRNRYGNRHKVTPTEEWFYNVDGWTHKFTIKNGEVIDIMDMGRN